MRIILFDLDLAEEVSRFPNHWLMKISSAYKQAGHTVKFVSHLDTDKFADRIFIGKQKTTNFLPSPKLLISDKTRLVGNFFKEFPNYWKVPLSVAQSRPDYLLYNNPNIVKMNYINLSHNGELIKFQPPAQDERLRLPMCVIDFDLWSLDSGDLLLAIKELQKYKKITFEEEINFTVLNAEILKEFVKLSFDGRQNKSKILYSLEEVISTLNSLKTIKDKKRFPIQNLKVMITKENLTIEESRERFFEAIDIINEFNLNRIDFIFVFPKEYNHPEIFNIFKGFENRKESFFSYIVRKDTNQKANIALNNMSYWRRNSVRLVWGMYKNNREYFEKAFTEWGGVKSIERKKLNEGDAKEHEVFIFRS